MAHWFSTDLSRLFAPSPVPAPTAASVYWDLVAGEGRLGSWTRANRQDRVRALARFQGALYAGIGPAQAEVWRLTDRGWEQVGGNDIAGSWPARDPATRGGVGLRPGHVWVNALLSDERDCWLYAGVKDGQLGAQLWRYDGRTWEQIGGRGGRGDWVSTDQDHVYALAWHQGKLYVGMQGHMTAFNVAAHDTAGVIRSAHGKGYHPGLGNGEIYRYDNGHWTCVAGRGRAGSWDENHAVTWVYALCSLGEELYAAIGRHAVRDLRWIGEVWRLRSGCWERIGGEGVRDSWRLDGTNLVTSLIEYQGKLIAGYNCAGSSADPRRFGNIWAWEPGNETWHQLALPASCADASIIPAQNIFNAAAVWDGCLVHTGGCADPVGHAAIWALSVAEGKWIGFGCPSAVASPGDRSLWARDAYGYSTTVLDGDLLVGCKGVEGTAHLWRCRKRRNA